MRRSTPGIGEAIHSSRSAWTLARRPKSAFRFITILRSTRPVMATGRLTHAPGHASIPRSQRKRRMPAQLEFGWFLPTSGDTTCYGDHSKFIQPSAELFDRVVLAAEAAGFEYFLVPVATTCWEAWISSAMAVAKTKHIKALVAARPGYVSPVQLA